ncbi:peptidyl-prolyl cis-trans isomerase FKBP9-like [Physella acuta]|uniref:peptidyl-prolyl cis-trans isomerase FKBP9-like n=1 Tax=Physella acuta TaxID=109671 RepID=UPI0027DC7162|nr:peptidyl-prolyl cis-trans isomerase FKBP9-like [Physella acuta]
MPNKYGYLIPSVDEANNKDGINAQNEIQNMQNGGYISYINQSIDGEAHSVDSSEPKYIHIGSFQGSPSIPVMSDLIDDEHDQSYIHPIDPDDPSLPISYGYHTWDGADDQATDGEINIVVSKAYEGILWKGDVLHMHYTGKLEDGTEFDSSIPRKEPFVFTLGTGQVIKGGDQGLLNMCDEEKRKLVILSDMGYGN